MQHILNETVVFDVIFPHSYVHVRPCLLTDRLLLHVLRDVPHISCVP